MTAPRWKPYGGVGPYGQGYCITLDGIEYVAWPLIQGWACSVNTCGAVDATGLTRGDAFEAAQRKVRQA